MPDEVLPVGTLEEAILALNAEAARIQQVTDYYETRIAELQQIVGELTEENQALKGQLCACRQDVEYEV